MSILHYFFWSPETRRVGGIGSIGSENWDIHAETLKERNFVMTPITNQAQLDEFQQHGPANFTVKPDFSLELLPPEQQNLVPLIIDNTDSSLEALNRKMDTLIGLIRKLVE